MEPLWEHWSLVTFTCWVLLMLLDANQSLFLMPALQEATTEEEDLSIPPLVSNAPLVDTFSLMMNVVNNFYLYCPANVLSDEMSFWVEPRLTTWFCRFLVDQYYNSCWLSMFCMTKTVVFALVDLLKPLVEKKNTRYRLAVFVVVHMACTLFKLTHGANLTICSEMFAINHSACCNVLREVVCAINETLKAEISWPNADRIHNIQNKFMDMCSLPGIVGAIGGMQIAISKLDFGTTDYYYFKSEGYSMNCQAVVNSKKRFLDLYVGMPGSTNDSRMLRRSTLFHLATHGNLFNANDSYEGHSPYLIGDQGYPLLSWLMVPHHARQQLSISEATFNRKLQKGRTVVENVFGILKLSFRELLEKSDLQLTFLPDVVVCCTILHNLLLRQSHDKAEDLLQLLRREGLQVVNDAEGVDDHANVVSGNTATKLDGILLCDNTWL